MNGLIPIFDNGHGGIINGKYQTQGKRSPNWESGILYEGAFNRWITSGLMEQMDAYKLPYYHISPELWDVSLNARVARANKITSTNPNTYLLSIHANAGGGTGIEGFTSIGDTASDPICEQFLTDLELPPLTETMRFDRYSDGDRDKERNYRVLSKTKGRAMLLELGFMDHPEDYKKLWDAAHRRKLIKSLLSTIERIYHIGL